MPGFGLSNSDKHRKTDEHPLGRSPRGEGLAGMAVLEQLPSGLGLSNSDKARRTDERPPGCSPYGEDRTDNLECSLSIVVAGTVATGSWEETALMP